MANEERDVPPLDVLLTDLTEMQARLDQGIKDADTDTVKLVDVLKNFLQNDFAPLVKDLVESSLFAFEDIQDIVNPVEIPQSEADNIVEILEATKASNVGNVLLTERIERGLSFLKPDEEDEGDDDEDDAN